MSIAMADAPLDLSPVYRHCVFRSDQPAGMHAAMARELARHDLRWKRGAGGTVLYKARAQRIEFFVLRYDADVEVWSQPFRDFLLVHMPLVAPLDITVDGTALTVAPGRAALVMPLRGIRLDCRSGAERLIVKIPLALLDEALGRAAPLAPARLLPPAFLLPAPQGAHWTRLLQSLIEVSGEPHGTRERRAWIAQLELTLTLYLLAHRPAPMAPERGDAADGARRLAALQREVCAALGRDWSLPALARAVGTSPRSLNQLVRREAGMTPMAWLRLQRLRAVQSALQEQPGAAVTDSALAAGFTHLGRFAAQYRAHFGELPHETLQRAARHRP